LREKKEPGQDPSKKAPWAIRWAQSLQPKRTPISDIVMTKLQKKEHCQGDKPEGGTGGQLVKSQASIVKIHRGGDHKGRGFSRGLVGGRRTSLQVPPTEVLTGSRLGRGGVSMQTWPDAGKGGPGLGGKCEIENSWRGLRAAERGGGWVGRGF